MTAIRSSTLENRVLKDNTKGVVQNRYHHIINVYFHLGLSKSERYQLETLLRAEHFRLVSKICEVFQNYIPWGKKYKVLRIKSKCIHIFSNRILGLGSEEISRFRDLLTAVSHFSCGNFLETGRYATFYLVKCSSRPMYIYTRRISVVINNLLHRLQIMCFQTFVLKLQISLYGILSKLFKVVDLLCNHRYYNLIVPLTFQ